MISYTEMGGRPETERKQEEELYISADSHVGRQSHLNKAWMRFALLESKGRDELASLD